MKAYVPDNESPKDRDLLNDAKTVLEMVQKNKSFAKYIIGPIDLRGANLRGANFQFAVFEETNLEGADLKGANLAGANMRRANLRYAVLYHCNLYKAALPLEIRPDEILLSVKEGTRIRYNPSLAMQEKMYKALKSFLKGKF